MSKINLWNVIEDRLRNNPTLSAYVKNVYNFDRKKIIDAEMPCITMQPLGTDEEYADFPKRKQDRVRIRIRGIIDIRGERINQATTTLYQLELDIKNAIENLESGSTDDLGFQLQGHYPKVRTISYDNLGDDVSAHVEIECEVDGRYFTVGKR